MNTLDPKMTIDKNGNIKMETTTASSSENFTIEISNNDVSVENDVIYVEVKQVPS